MARLHQRMLGAALLRAETYEEVEADRDATGQAFFVVLLAALANGIGSFSNGGFVGIFWITLAFLAAWYLWAQITCVIGTRLLPTAETVSDTGELLRTIGFASTPGILGVLALVPPIAGVVFPVCALWMAIAMVVAVRQALDYRSTARAVLVCAIGFVLFIVILAIALLLLGPWPI